MSMNRRKLVGGHPVVFGPVGSRGRRAGYTLLEILVATTLALILMYGVASIFSQVGTLMSETQNVMGMSNSLRSAKERLRTDLRRVTVPRLLPPTSQYGFFSYAEGLGADYSRVIALLDGDGNYQAIDTAWNGDLRGTQLDKTVGDTDDVLSFTARAPAGEWFRGRMIARDYVFDTSISGFDPTAPPPTEIIESEYAEIIWFVRGTTLYRRVLLIVPDGELQRRLTEADRFAAYNSQPNVSNGYGFYRFFDVSVHQENGRLIANRLADLSNRRNRFGSWSSPADEGNRMTAQTRADAGTHGRFGAWYWLRMPTMQESLTVPTDSALFSDSLRYFRAGSPFGVEDNTVVPNQDAFRWFGSFQELYANNESASSANVRSDTLPDTGPFIDFWNSPNVWLQPNNTSFNNGVDIETGDLWFAHYPSQTDPVALGTAADLSNADVMLTNVISFDVRAWDSEEMAYVNLGQESSFLDINDMDRLNASKSFRLPGWYKLRNGNVAGFSPDAADPCVSIGDVLNFPFLPAVFDTWTEAYEREHLLKTFTGSDNNTYTGVSRRPGFTASEIPLDGTVTADQLPDYPPPYSIELKGLKVEMRVFDPVSRSIRNVSLEIDMSNR